MSNNLNHPFLTIGIPTYNGGFKLDRLLKILKSQIDNDNLQDDVEVLICDNGSIDNTREIISKCKIYFKNLRSISHKNNIGFDLNVFSVYNNSYGKYVWLFSDNDIPFEGSILRIINSLTENKLDLLLFSFSQPPGSKTGVFNFKEKLYITNNYSEIIELILRWKKISVYVLKKSNFSLGKNKIVNYFIGQNWFHVVLALTILDDLEKKSSIGIISDILAGCDDDFDKWSFTPDPILNSYRLAYHPLVKEIIPNLAESLEKKSYLESIQFCFAAKRGTLRATNMSSYDNFILKLPFKLFFLILEPKYLLQFILLKFRVVYLFNHILK